ncbi:hypothetical protein, partial [Pseudomonas poae]|uniref:hypothetical protein n=1 Tax=Pseudomonas poae TaxID=200451 RepID=UPI0034D47B05
NNTLTKRQNNKTQKNPTKLNQNPHAHNTTHKVQTYLLKMKNNTTTHSQNGKTTKLKKTNET